MKVYVQPSAKSAADFAAELIARELRAHPHLVMGLATGRTMEQVYAQLVEMHETSGLDFAACHTFNLDEYVGLSENDPNSYRYYMNHHLFEHVNIDMGNTRLPDGTAANLEAECFKYERFIINSGGIDLQLLGIGLNGHIGFNEPPSAFDSRTRVITLSPATRKQNAGLFESFDQVPQQAITMGMGTILESRRCLLVATGEDKADIVAAALEGPVTDTIPATALKKHPVCTFVLDEAAAGRLKIPVQRE